MPDVLRMLITGDANSFSRAIRKASHGNATDTDVKRFLRLLDSNAEPPPGIDPEDIATLRSIRRDPLEIKRTRVVYEMTKEGFGLEEPLRVAHRDALDYFIQTADDLSAVEIKEELRLLAGIIDRRPNGMKQFEAFLRARDALDRIAKKKR